MDGELKKELAKVCGEQPENIRVLHVFDRATGRFLGLPGDYEWYYLCDTPTPIMLYLVGEDEEGFTLLDEEVYEDLLRRW